MVEITVIVAFAAGLISFLSPCVLPLIPAFLGYLSGVSATGELKAKYRSIIFINTLFFVVGFSSIFAIVGVLINGVFANIGFTLQMWLARIGGIVIIVFGLFLMGLISIPFLERDHKLEVKRKFKYSYVTSFVFGAAFAVGWTPCVSALLGSILVLSAISPGSAFTLLLAYAMGLSVPFLLTGLFLTRATDFINRNASKLTSFNKIVGILLVILGILVFTNKLVLIANFLVPPGWLA